MWHVLVWLIIALLAAPWTLACLGLHWLLTGPDWSSGAVQDWLSWLEQWQIPLWLAAWLPLEAITALKTWLTALGPWVEGVIGQAPALLGWLVPLLWIGWGLGLLVLALFGVAGSVLVVALQRRPAPLPA
jgi:hypothetical protein